MIAVIFAVPHESREFRRALRDTTRIGQRGWLCGRLGREEVLVVHTGIGVQAAGSEVYALLEEMSPTWLLSAGFAGGLDARLPRGTVFVAENFSSSELVARCPLLPRWKMTTQAAAVETPGKKSAMAGATGAQAVDMETSAVVQAAGGRPILALRVISDAAADTIPVPLEVAYDIAARRARPLALGAFLARHPGKIVPFVHFLEHLSAARRALAKAIQAAIESS